MKFKADLSQLAALQKLYKKNPRLYRVAETKMLNDLAFRGKKIAPKEIAKGNIVRAPRFISQAIRVEKANRGRPQAVFGTISRDRFTGLKEQQFGKTAKRHRVAGTKTRSGLNKRGQIVARNRLKPSLKVWRPSRFKLGRGKGKDNQTAAFLDRISREPTASRKPFWISKQYKGFAPGIYRMMGRDKIRKLWTFEDMKPKRFRWMNKTIRKTYSPKFAMLSFAKALKDQQRRNVPKELRR